MELYLLAKNQPKEKGVYTFYVDIEEESVLFNAEMKEVHLFGENKKILQAEFDYFDLWDSKNLTAPDHIKWLPEKINLKPFQVKIETSLNRCPFCDQEPEVFFCDKGITNKAPKLNSEYYLSCCEFTAGSQRKAKLSTLILSWNNALNGVQY